jgi:hypothetical protein
MLMVSEGQTFTHSPQPVHFSGSMTVATFLSIIIPPELDKLPWMGLKLQTWQEINNRKDGAARGAHAAGALALRERVHNFSHFPL